VDFFERQDRARSRTARLVLVFALTVAAILVTMVVAAWAALAWSGRAPWDFLAWLRGPVAWIVIAVAALLLLGGSAVRWLDLRAGGGGRVARMMGGRQLDPETTHPQEKVLIHVVEEVAIAAGLTVPDVYILDGENGINAFAAGFAPANSVIAVTAGMLDGLDRDQLQGVVAHEFSHILNGDVALNIRLLALLAGITIVGETGMAFWRGMLQGSVGMRGRAVRLRSDRRGGNAAILPLLGVATALVVIGWIGVFAGRLIKAAVSRQREFLADAAAVQLTRNPDGLAGALLRIHEAPEGSVLHARHAEEISHMGFGRTVGGLTRLTATHPGIEARMDALGPKYRLWYRRASREHARRQRERHATTSTPLVEGTAAAPGPPRENADAHLSAAGLAALAGTTGPVALDLSRWFLQRLPPAVRTAAANPGRACDVVWAVLLHTFPDRPGDHAALPHAIVADVEAMRTSLEETFPDARGGGLDPRVRLPLLELCGPALRRLDATERTRFLEWTDALIRSDGRVAIFEFTARTLLTAMLHPPSRNPATVSSLVAAIDDVRRVFSVVCLAGSARPDDRARAYTTALRPLLPGSSIGSPLPPTDCDLAGFSASLHRLRGLPPLARRSLLVACGDCVAADGNIRPAEAELLRAVAAALDAPIPPLGNDALS